MEEAAEAVSVVEVEVSEAVVEEEAVEVSVALEAALACIVPPIGITDIVLIMAPDITVLDITEVDTMGVDAVTTEEVVEQGLLFFLPLYF